jgi:hypothetical protein
LARSLDEKVLIAAYYLEKSGQSPFTAEDLVIAAWKKYPDAFGLEGYGDKYPDSNRVFTKIMGDKGLRGKGWLLKAGEKLYNLSDAGKLYAASIANDSISSASRASLDRKQKETLQKLLQSKAVLKVKNQMNNQLIFLDACSFWEISPRSISNTLIARLATINAIVKVCEEIILDKGAIAIIHGDIPITLEDVNLIKLTHQILLEKFSKEIDIIKNRKDER